MVDFIVAVLFTSEPFEDAIQSQGADHSQAAGLYKAASVDNASPLLVRSLAFRAQEELEGQTWYHGVMSRREAEKLLRDDGDFLVRKSTTNPGSYVLTGMHNGLAKHLLLVDPEGTVRWRDTWAEVNQLLTNALNSFLSSKVRTKDHVFDSILHLIGHHRDNNLPILSAGSELFLLQPVGRKPWRLRCLMGERKLRTVSCTILKLKDETGRGDSVGRRRICLRLKKIHL